MTTRIEVTRLDAQSLPYHFVVGGKTFVLDVSGVANRYYLVEEGAGRPWLGRWRISKDFNRVLAASLVLVLEVAAYYENA